ncbi:MAG: hypothetical protein IAF58_07910 [Leptolyngbya sp.]|nr:hypothetical protein [Candidatus Melainabacteria bacterium]
MREKDVKAAAYELLCEAGRGGELLMKLSNEFGDFVKAKKAYTESDETRLLYLEALEWLEGEEKVVATMKSKDMILYRVSDTGKKSRHTREQARDILMEALHENGSIVKVHSTDGEYIQAGSVIYSEIDEERICFLDAFGHLLHHSMITPVNETREVTVYVFANKAGLRKAV